MSGKYALIIGNTDYNDPGLAKLTAPGRDAEDLAHILQDPEIGAFDDVKILLNQFSSTIIEAIDDFFNHKKPDDLLILYFSGHGIRDEFGALYLAVRNTFRAKLRSTAVKSDYIREVMDQSRARRQVLILDCCNSGAFAQGAKAATGVSIGTASAFEGGYGRVILTASDSTQFAWEGDVVIGETDNSLFTHYLVEGLKGEADLNGDGRITVDELYDYAYEKVKLATPKQTPSKFSSKQQGEIVLRQSSRVEDIKPVPLPQALLDSIDNPFSDVRLGAVQQLIKLMNGKNLGLAKSAREVLERVMEGDDSRTVSNAARQALEAARGASDRNYIAEEIERAGARQIVNERVEKAERLEPEKAERFSAQRSGPGQEFPTTETERAAMPIVNRQALITLGWAIAGAIAGTTYNLADEAIGGGLGGAIGGALGAGITAIALQLENYRSHWKRIILFTLAWTVGLSIGWFIGELGTEPIPFAIGYAIGATVSVVILLSFGYVFTNMQSMAWIVLAWTIGGSTGWTIARKLMIETWSIDNATSWTIGTAMGWVIGGYVLGWQSLNTANKAEATAEKSNERNKSTTALSSRADSKHFPAWVSVIWITLGWVISAAIALGLAAVINEVLPGSEASFLAFPVFGAIGGLGMAIALRIEHVLSSWKSWLWIVLGWTIGGALIAAGILLNLAVDSRNLAVLFAIFGAIGGFTTAITLRINRKLSDWKNLVWITLGWAIGWSISLMTDSITSVIPLVTLIVTTIGVATGGLIMVWRMREQAGKSEQ